MINVILAFGSNLGNRVSHIESAIQRLEQNGVSCLKLSAYYETSPILMREQPAFINAVGLFSTGRDLFAVLDLALAVEAQMGRVRDQDKGPRMIDIDLIACENLTAYTARLSVPHPALHERMFVLEPLMEIAPDLVIPGYRGLAVAELRQQCRDTESSPQRLSEQG